MKLTLRTSSKVIIALYGITVLFWIFLVVLAHQNPVNSDLLTNLRRFTQLPLIFIPLAGGLMGIRNALNWGGRTSIIGRSTLGFSLGLIAWSGGMVIWNYYLFFTNNIVPYPSLADAIFILSWPLWAYGLIQLSKAIGVQMALRTKGSKTLLLVVSALLSIISVYLLVFVARNGITYENPVKLFFDLFYPLGDIVILCITVIAYLLSRELLGGIYRLPVLILIIGFVMNYFSDFLFSYTTTNGTYFNGHLVDFLFTTTMFILSLGLSLLSYPFTHQHTEEVSAS